MKVLLQYVIAIQESDLKKSKKLIRKATYFRRHTDRSWLKVSEGSSNREFLLFKASSRTT
jgi:hypothetical protein